MSEQHTPGPWIVTGGMPPYKIMAQQGPLNVCPAIAHGLPDARLIAAAPDIHKALKAALAALPWRERDPEWAAQARAAVAKAENRT